MKTKFIKLDGKDRELIESFEYVALVLFGFFIIVGIPTIAMYVSTVSHILAAIVMICWIILMFIMCGDGPGL